MSEDLTAYKEAAAAEAVKLVERGMRLGLGSGSTAAAFVRHLGGRVRDDGLNVICVSTSEMTQALADDQGIPTATLDEYPELDLAVDGTDEIDGKLRLIKGGGGAHVREKIVAASAERFVVIADHTKKVDLLGAFPLPIEIVPFGVKATLRHLEEAARMVGVGGAFVERMTPDGRVLETDNGNVILDARFEEIANPEAVAQALDAVPGVVGHGLFLGMATGAILSGPAGIETMGDV
ncbi:MAG: ribose-5-phosphate isomerase RpiA [Pseudomonadota bacterium]